MESLFKDLESPPHAPPVTSIPCGFNLQRSPAKTLSFAFEGPSLRPSCLEADAELPPCWSSPPSMKEKKEAIEEEEETNPGRTVLEEDEIESLDSQQELGFVERSDGLAKVPPPQSKAGWLLLGRQPTLHASWFAKAAAGGVMESVFWRKVYVDLPESWSELRCWQAPPKEVGFSHESPHPILSVPLAKLDEVSVKNKSIALHLQGQRHLIRLTAPSKEEADEWGAAIRAAGARAVGTGLPKGWDVNAMLCSGLHGASPRMVVKEHLPQTANKSMQQLLDHSFMCKSTKDRRGNDMPFRLEACSVIQVQNGSGWTEYNETRARVAAAMAASGPSAAESAAESSAAVCEEQATLSPPVLTSTLSDPGLLALLGDLDASANEQWLFHGTSAAAVQGISDHEFRLDLAGRNRGTMYGRGLYFAECSSKADEYSEEDEDGYCWMLLCRAVLGRVMINQDVRPSPDLAAQCRAGGYNSVCGDRWRAVGTFREFVLYEAKQVYPSFIIRYKRCSEAQVCKALRDASEADPDCILPQLVPHVACLATQHPDGAVDSRLSLLLGTLMDEVVPHLTNGLHSSSCHTRRACAILLKDLTKQSIVAAAAVEYLGQPKRGKVSPSLVATVPTLTRCLADEDEQVRSDAAATLQLLKVKRGDAAEVAPALTAAASRLPERQ